MVRSLVREICTVAFIASIAGCSSGSGATPPVPTGGVASGSAGFSPRSNTTLVHTTLPDVRAAGVDAVVQHEAAMSTQRTSQSSTTSHDIEQVGVFINPGGAYSSLYARQSAYPASQIQIAYPPGSTDTSAVYESLVAPNGGCLGNFATWINRGSGTQAIFAVYNYCGLSPGIVFETPIDANFLAKYTQPYSDGIPMYATEVFTYDLTPSRNSVWHSIIYNVQTQQYEELARVTGLNPSSTGFVLWTSELQPQPCPAIPKMGAEYAEMWDNAANHFTYVTPTLSGSTSQISTPPSSPGCFQSDATGPASYVFTVVDANDHFLIAPKSSGATIAEYSVPGATDVAALGDDAWVTEGANLNVARVTSSGNISEYSVPPAQQALSGSGCPSFATAIVAGTGSLWTVVSGERCVFPTETQLLAGGQLGQTYPLLCQLAANFPKCQTPVSGVLGADGAIWLTMTPAEAIAGEQGHVYRFDVASGKSVMEENLPPTCGKPTICQPEGITSGPDGALWFTINATSGFTYVARLTTSGQEMNFPIVPGDQPGAIVSGPDGALWLTMLNGGQPAIGRFATNNSLQTFPLPAGAFSDFLPPRGIAAGHDGALWFTEPGINKIGRITTSGSISQFDIPTQSSDPTSIVSGAGDTLWFVESAANKVGKLTY